MCVNSACSVNALRPDARVGFIFPLDQSFTNGVLGFTGMSEVKSKYAMFILFMHRRK